MGSASRYLLSHFASTFLSLFATLFLIISITFFIKMSKITAIVEISFSELGKLFLFVLPEILLFTIPLSFFIGLCLSLFRLSKESETIVLFTLGYKPKKIAVFFGIISFLVSLFLLIDSLVLIPISDQLNKNFIDFKKNEAKLNIKPSEVGQKFSNWMIYVNSSKDTNNSRKYGGIIMYQPENEKNNQKLILSNTATLQNNQGKLSLVLNKGSAYDITKDVIHKTNYKNMILRAKNQSSLRSIESILSYWKEIKTSKKRARNFALYTLMSMFPLATFLFALSFGIVTYRYQRNEIYGAIFAVVLIYFALTVMFSRSYPLIGIPIVISSTLAISYNFFKRKILRVY